MNKSSDHSLEDIVANIYLKDKSSENGVKQLFRRSSLFHTGQQTTNSW